MKTHLPHRLRAALMAALASVSITTGYGAAPLIEGQYAVDWTKVTLTDKGQITGNNSPGVFCPTYTAQASHYDGSQTSIEHINVVRAESQYKTGDIYFDVINAQQTDSRSIVGVNQSVSTTANIYTRIGNAQSDHLINVVVGVDSDVNLNGNVYMELADSKATYRYSVAGSRSSITGSSTLVIRAGTFDERVAAGFSAAEKAGYKIGNGAYLQIEDGTFNGDVMGGSGPISNTATIDGGSHLLINGGTFNKNVYGGSGGIYGVVNGGVDITVSGGTFNPGSNIYALGAYGKVSGAVNLTIGNNAKFLGDNVISAGTYDTATYTGSPSQVTLKNLTGTSSLATDRTITVDGGAQKSWLVMENVDTTIKARLTNFSSMSVKEGSDLTLNSTNAGLGGASSVWIEDGSTLTLDSGESGSSWDWNLNGRTITGEGTLKLKGEGALSITDSTELFTKVDMGSGTLSVDNTMQDKEIKAVSGSGTLAKTGAGKTTVKDASGFTGKIDAAGGGTLQLEKVDLTGAKAPQKVSVSNGATVNLIDVNQGKDGASIELSIAGGTFGVYANDQDPDAGTVGALTLAGGSKITIGAGTRANVLEANLVTLSGSVLDFTSSGELTMGCTLDVKDGTIVLLNADDFDGLKNGTLDSVTLFNGIDNTSMDAANVIICRGAAEGAETLTAQVDFHTDGTLSVKGVPEPATGTLSLLALAGLCARRRRKH